MSKHNKFLKLIKLKLYKEKEKNLICDFNDSITIEHELYHKKIPKKTTSINYYPLRKLLFWGYDKENNPSFLILYGTHKFNAKNSSENEFEEDVLYTDYAVFHGKEGHFPSFESVKILGSLNKKMYYKKDIEGNGYWYKKHEENALKNFKNLKNHESISIPYFKGLTYKDHLNILILKNINFDDFTLASTPLNMLNLSQDLLKYYPYIYKIFSDLNIYTRKKYLKELMNLNPPKKLYDLLFKIGSAELISGLFLEFSNLKNLSFINEAKKLIKSDEIFADENYASGIKRCATMYLNNFDEDLKNARINFIKTNLKDMDLHVFKVNGKIIPEDKILDGYTYRKYAIQGHLAKYHYEYDYKQRKSIKINHDDLYKKSYYSNGTSLNINNFKNTIQEAEIFDLFDVLGKIAYYLDAPRLTYYFKGSGNYKALMYFRRYLRRIIDSYAKTSEAKFMETMKSLFSSYTEIDYTCKFKGNFQFNYFIKYYLYNDFNLNTSEICYWNDNLSELTGRHELNKEIWNANLSYVALIASCAKVDVISKAMYYILKDPCNENSLNDLTYESIIKLNESSYKPILDLALDLLKNKLKNEKDFNMDLMIQLVNCPNKEINKIAMDYFNNTKGKFSSETMLTFLFFEKSNEWIPLIEENLEKLNSKEYLKFLYLTFENSDKFKEHNIAWPKDLEDIIKNSLYKLTKSSQNEQDCLILYVINKIQNDENILSYILSLMEEIIFSSTFEELQSFLKSKDIKLKLTQNKTKLATSLLLSIKNNTLVNDSIIIEILEKGSPCVVKSLIETIENYKYELNNRFQTIIMLFESDAFVLNDIAKEVFESLKEEEKKKLHILILDSPDEKVYSYGLLKLKDLYEDNGKFIPKEFIAMMFEHPSIEVKNYISDKVNEVIENPQHCNEDLFMYYSKSILYLPNKASKAKNNIYNILPVFAINHKDKIQNIEEILLDIGASNIILDSERALVALCKIKKEAY